MFMKNTKAVLAGRTYTIESLKFKAERAWRKTFDAPITNLVNTLSQTRTITSESNDAKQWLQQVGSMVLSHAGELVRAMIDSPDTMLDAICAYSPALAADRDFIEENAYQDEIAAAFVEVLKIAYPFGTLLGMITSLGSQEKQTMPSSPSPSGDSSKTN